jgi:hypothetical protein
MVKIVLLISSSSSSSNKMTTMKYILSLDLIRTQDKRHDHYDSDVSCELILQA